MWGHGEKAAACTPGRDTSEETSPARSLISNPDRLQSLQLVADGHWEAAQLMLFKF